MRDRPLRMRPCPWEPRLHRPPQLSASTATMRSTEPSTARWTSTGRAGPPLGLGGNGGQGGPCPSPDTPQIPNSTFPTPILTLPSPISVPPPQS